METRSCDEVAEILKSREAEYFDQSSSSEEDSTIKYMSEDESEEVVSDMDSEYKVSTRRKKPKIIEKPTKSSSKGFIYGKNRYKWTTIAPEAREQERLVTYIPAGKGVAAKVESPMAAWSLLIPDELLNIIVTHTNAEIANRRENIVEQTFTYDLDLIELKAFLGILYFSGVRNNNGNNDTLKLWGGLMIYQLTMPRERFAFLLETLRFDDKNTRAERRKIDKLAPIREIWELMLTMCKQYYTPHKYCTIGEQLLSFRGRCPFRIYRTAKPDEYGMNIIMLNDAKTSYMVNAILYVGDVANREKNESLPSYYVRTVSEPIHGSTRNITCNNWFTSIPIVDTMQKFYSITMIGTLRKNKPEIPDKLKTFSHVGATKFAYSDNKTLLSYYPKKNKIVLLLSSFHKTGNYDSNTGKPEIINFYNSTKEGTNTFDQMCHEYSVTRVTRRWSVRFFYGMLDQAGINAYILFTLNAKNDKTFRAIFLENLSNELITPFMRRRAHLLLANTLHIPVTPEQAIMENVLSTAYPDDER